MKFSAKRKPNFAPKATITPNLNVPFRERVMLVKYHERVWSTTRQNRVVTNEVLKANNAEKDAGAFYERLLPKAAFADSKRIRLEAYQYHIQVTSPWLDEGTRALPIGMLRDYLDKMRVFGEQAKEADTNALAGLDKHIEAAKKMRGKMFSLTDYPSKEEVAARKFALEVHVMPLPNVEDWRVPDLPGINKEEVKREALATYNKLQQQIAVDLYERLLDVVTKMRDKMKDPKGIFRNSLISNIKEMLVLVGKLNVTGDPKLEALRQEIKQKLVKQSPDELREAPELRKAAAKDADDIISKMSAYMGGTK